MIPIKDPRNAKTRLGELLSLSERGQLAWAMFEDVSIAVTAARKPDRIVLVTSYSPAIERARLLGWDVLIEEAQISESTSVDWASGVLSDQGFDTVLRLPADVPLVRGEDIDELLSIKLDSPGALIVPSREGTGTNAIVRTPANLFPSRFGPNSLSLHKQEAARVGVECAILNNPRIALDIDEPADVERLLEAGHGTRSFDALGRMNALERLERKKSWTF
ncbi:MAG: 2-phospho-L-lactate guanylyltransferase [Blastocatellia bacterium]